MFDFIARVFSPVPLTSIALWSFCTCVPAAAPPTTQSSVALTAVLTPILNRHNVPALAAVVVQGDQLRAAGAVGARRRGSREQVTASDRFHIGSNTKSMTATLCAMLVEEGKLKWESTVADIFPELKKEMHPAWHGVTLEQLLTHRGGAPADLSADGLNRKLWEHKGTPTSARRALLKGVTARAPEATPGEKFIYSNAGYAIAGHMAEKVTGRSWEELMRDKLFRPLKMTSAGFGAPGTRALNDQPRGHGPDNAPIEPGPAADNPVAIGPAGTVHCTLADYAKFLTLHAQGARGESKLLKPESFKKLQTPPAEQEYAKGWIVVKHPATKKTMLMHSGSNTLWYCTACVIPEMGLALAVACNQAGPGEKACDEAIAALIGEYGR